MRAPTAMILGVSAFLSLASRGLAQGHDTSLQGGVTPVAGESAFELGARFSPRGSLGPDFSVDVYPEYLAQGVLSGIADLSLAAKLRLGPVAIVPRVGVSLLGVLGTGGAVAADGFNAGVGVVLTLDTRTVLRADYTYRQLDLGDELYTVPSLTAGFVINR